MKSEYVYEGLERNVSQRFHTSNYEVERLPMAINKKVIGLMKDELSEDIMREYGPSA